MTLGRNFGPASAEPRGRPRVYPAMRHLTLELWWWGERIASEEVRVNGPRRLESIDGVPLLAPIEIDGPVVRRRGTPDPFTCVTARASAAEAHPGRAKAAWRTAIVPALLTAAVHAALIVASWTEPVGSALDGTSAPIDVRRLAHGDEPIVPRRGAWHGAVSGASTGAERASATPSATSRGPRARGPRERGEDDVRGAIASSTLLTSLGRFFRGPAGTPFASAAVVPETGSSLDGLGAPGRRAEAVAGAGRLVPVVRGAPNGALDGVRPTRTPGAPEGLCTGDDCAYRYGIGCGGCGSTYGELPREVVRRAMRRLHGALRSCAGATHAVAHARVEVDFLITPAGRPTAITVRSDALPEVEGCLAVALERVSFPAALGPTGVHYPYVLTLE